MLNTQNQVDSFRINYPSECTQVVQDLIISGEDITHLDSLLGLNFIGRDLIISGNLLLTTLHGLDSIVVVGRHLKIEDNLQLFDVNGLNGLQSIIGQLWIRNNPSLQHVDGLENLSGIIDNFRLEGNAALADVSGLKSLGAVGGNFLINNNVSLPNLYNLRKLMSVGGTLQIKGNSSLVQVSDLSHLQSIGGHLIIWGNDVLQSVHGFIHLTSIGGYLYIRNNPVLPDLLGLDNIDPTGIVFLIIKDNASLSLCSVMSVCEYLNGTGPRVINGNPASCATEAQVADLCLLLPVSLVSFEAEVKAEGVLLRWETEDETENLGFNIQRSADAQKWEDIGFVSSSGGGVYSFLDEHPFSGRGFYRLQQVDPDGLSAYSPVASAVWGEAFRQIFVYSNPVENFLWVGGLSGLSANEEVPYALYDLAGRLMRRGVLEGAPIDLSDLPAGFYQLRLELYGNEQIFKVMK